MNPIFFFTEEYHYSRLRPKPVLLPTLRDKCPRFFEIIDYLYLDIKFPIMLEDYDAIPPGWKLRGLHHAIYDARTRFRISIKDVYISEAGRLNFTTIDPQQYNRKDYPDIQFYWYKKGIADFSIYSCMVCGERARQRKEEDKSPVLCEEHYIQYINEMSEYEEYVSLINF